MFGQGKAGGQFIGGKKRLQAVIAQAVVLVLLVGVSALGIGAYVNSSNQADTNPASHPAEVAADNSSVDVIVPLETVETGTALEAALFKKERRSILTIDPDTVRDFEEVKGLYTRGLLVAGQPVHRGYLTTLQPVNKLTASIPVGYRAIAINVDTTSSVEGWAQAGARVDVLWIPCMDRTTRDWRMTSLTQMSCNIASDTQNSIIFIAENVKVLSANRQAEGGQNQESADPQQEGQQTNQENQPQTVTLLLPHKDALRVRLAAMTGKLSMVLRGTEDPGKTNGGFPSLERSDLFHMNLPQAAPEQRQVTSVKVKGKDGSSTELLFDNSGRRINE